MMTDNNLCETCAINPIRYDLYLTEDIICPYCKTIKHKKNILRLLLCSTKCDGLYWWVSEYITPVGSSNVKIIFCLEKDECIKCGKQDFPEAIFEGKCLDKISKTKYVSHKKSKK